MISSIQFYPDLPASCPGFTQCKCASSTDVWSAPVGGSQTSVLTFKRFSDDEKFSTKEQMCSISPCLQACLSARLSLLSFPRGDAPVRKRRNGCKGHWVPIRSTSLNPVYAQFMPLCFGNGGEKKKQKTCADLGREKKQLACPVLFLLVKQKLDRTL